MEISKTDYLKIDFDVSTKMLKALWYAQSVELNDENFKKELYKWRDAINKCEPELLLVDSRDMNFTIHPQMQEWFVTDIFPAYASVGVKKNAFLVAHELITALSIEQAIDEDKNAPYQTKYFHSQTDAMNWLMGTDSQLKYLLK